MDEKLYNAKQAASILGLHQATIRKWANSGKLKGTRVGNVWLFSDADLEACQPKANNGRRPSRGAIPANPENL